MNFYKVFFQREGSSEVKDTIKDFDVYAKSIPFSLFGDAKNVVTNEWPDENGDDEFVSASGIKFKGYEIDTEWAVKGPKYSSNSKILSFVDYLTGEGSTPPVFKMYDEYNAIGRKGVRFVKLEDKADLFRDNENDILVFRIRLKVNDPVTGVSVFKNSKGEVISLTVKTVSKT